LELGNPIFPGTIEIPVVEQAPVVFTMDTDPLQVIVTSGDPARNAFQTPSISATVALPTFMSTDPILAIVTNGDPVTLFFKTDVLHATVTDPVQLILPLDTEPVTAIVTDPMMFTFSLETPLIHALVASGLPATVPLATLNLIISVVNPSFAPTSLLTPWIHALVVSGLPSPFFLTTEILHVLITNPTPGSYSLITQMVTARVYGMIGPLLSAFSTPILVATITDPKTVATDVKSLYSTLVLTVGTGAQLDFRPVLEELMRLQRVTEQLKLAIESIRMPGDIAPLANDNLKKAANSLADTLIAIPSFWQKLENRPDLPNYDFVPDGYPTTSTGTVLASLTGEQLLTNYGRPGDWQDLIEWLKAILLRRLAELGFQ
jgi:hypothetical protein